MDLESLLSTAPCSAAVIVAHPDDETLWAGGLLLAYPDCGWHVTTLCRAGDPDRAPRFRQAVGRLHAAGAMADLDDGPDQVPLVPEEVQRTILAHLPRTSFDLILTHGPQGEYTRHRRHEEVSRAVANLWRAGAISTRMLAMFAYEDGQRAYLPRPRPDAHVTIPLPETLWQQKQSIMTAVYGFVPESWEVRTTPREEAFWCFDSPEALDGWMQEKGLDR